MKINVLYCSDDNYAPYAGISMLSLLENNKEVEQIVFYVVYDNISQENLNRLECQVKKYGDSRKLVLINGESWIKLLQKMGVMPYRGGHANDLRLFFSEYIGEDVERLLYLDCDTIVCGKLQELFETLMGENIAAVVLDSLSSSYKKLIGFKQEEFYFNSGVILFDVKNWRAFHCEDKLRRLIQNPTYHYPNPDQDFLNFLLKDKKIVLSPKYNFQTTHKVYSDRIYYASYPQTGYYNSEEIDHARREPVILHAYRFLGQFPWHENSIHPWKKLFWEYVERSCWSDLDAKKNTRGLFVVERLVYRMLPQFIFLPLFQLWQSYYFWKKLKVMRRHKGDSACE